MREFPKNLYGRENELTLCFHAAQRHMNRKHATELIEGTGVPGQIIAIDKLGPSIACAEGAIRVLRIQRPGKKPVTGAEYVRSQSLELGDRLEGE